MIRIDKLTKIFPSGTKAVDELDLAVESGEILALLGPNGAGKSTTIRVLSTLCGFDAGKVVVAGSDVDKEANKVRASIGLVAQQTGVDFFLTGRENLHLHGQLYHLTRKEIKSRVTELSQYFELDDALDKQVMTYSGGMRRKLDIASALIHKPKVLFLDEPTLGLDIQSRKNLWRYVEQLNQQLQLTILLTTHYLEEADKLAHRVAIINQGKICVVNSPEALKNDFGGDSVTLSFDERNDTTHQLEQHLQQQDYVQRSLWEGSRLHLYVDHGASSIPKITQLANEHQLQINDLNLSRPSLDDVFIQYTGNRIESNAEEGEEQWWQQWAGKDGGGKWQKQWQEQNKKTADASDTEQWQANDEARDSSAEKAPAEQSDTAGNEQAREDQSSQDWKKWQSNSDADTQDWQRWQKNDK